MTLAVCYIVSDIVPYVYIPCPSISNVRFTFNIVASPSDSLVHYASLPSRLDPCRQRFSSNFNLTPTCCAERRGAAARPRDSARIRRRAHASRAMHALYAFCTAAAASTSARVCHSPRAHRPMNLPRRPVVCPQAVRVAVDPLHGQLGPRPVGRPEG
jgi:hypothetical protein